MSAGDLTTLPPRHGKSIAVIEAPLRPDAVVKAFGMADWCGKLRRGATMIDGERLPSFDHTARSLAITAEADRPGIIERAKCIRRMLLPAATRIADAVEQYTEFVDPDSEHGIGPAQASVMVRGLVDAIIGKKRNQEDEAKLDAMVLMFDPAVNAIGASTKLWGEVPRHPVVIALGIMSMLYKTQTFCPAPAELAVACRMARGRLREQLRHMEACISDLSRAEEVVFDCARDDWASVYTTKQMAEHTGIFMEYIHRGKNFDKWCDTLDAIVHEFDFKTIREAIGNNGKAEVVKRAVQEGGAVPDGVALQPMPSELIEEFPGLANCHYFLTAQQIVIVEDHQIVQVIPRRSLVKSGV
jgi:hypothetical protein